MVESLEIKRAKNAARMRLSRKNNPVPHREREKARYRKKKQENPELLRAQGRARMASWRVANRKRSLENQRRWYRENPERVRAALLKYRYGISTASWGAIFKAQNSVCAICGVDNPRRGWALDHCHETGKVRGILCHGCNTALGFMSDDPERLEAAAKYLKSHRK